MFKSVIVPDLKTLMQTPEPLVPVESWGRGEGSVSPVLGLPPTSLRNPLKSNTCDIMHVDIGCSSSLRLHFTPKGEAGGADSEPPDQSGCCRTLLLPVAAHLPQAQHSTGLEVNWELFTCERLLKAAGLILLSIGASSMQLDAGKQRVVVWGALKLPRGHLLLLKPVPFVAKACCYFGILNLSYPKHGAAATKVCS